MTKGVAAFTEEEKERALAVIRSHPQMPVADLVRQIGGSISAHTIARWRKEIQEETGNMGQQGGGDGTAGEGAEKQLTDKQRLRALEEFAQSQQRRLEAQDLQLRYLRRYAKETDELRRSQINNEYLIALLGVYGCENPQGLDDDAD